MIPDLRVAEKLRGPAVPEEHVAALALALAAKPHAVERFADRQRLHRPAVSRWAAIGRENLQGGHDAIPARRER